MLEDELTSQQAADMLGVSRPWLTKNLRPWRMVGNRRRYRRHQIEELGRELRRQSPKVSA